MTDRALFELERIVDNPKYEGFAFANRTSLRGKKSLTDDFMPDHVVEEGRAWKVTRMAHLWWPQPVVGRVRPFNDFPCINLIIPAFSRRSVDALREFLEANGELLPLQTDVGEYFVYNVTTVADILDRERATVEYFNEMPHIALSIDHFELHEDRLKDLSIFRLVEEPSRTYVTGRFASRVREHRLEGFAFVKVWPYPKGVDWRKPPKYEVSCEAEGACGKE
jgi:hypothetical protein